MSGDVELSVIIPCLNGGTYLARMLRSLADQRLGTDWEVVVADNGSTDDSMGVCRAFASELQLATCDASDRRGQAHARNVGAARASGTNLVFLDQDDEVSPGYLSAVSDALDRHPFVAASREFASLNPVWAVRARGTATSSGLLPGLYPWAYGCTLAVARKCFDAVGGFDEELLCAEDVDFCWRIQRDCPAQLRLVEEAVLRYRFKDSFRDLFRQGMLYGRGGPALYKKWSAYGMERRPVGEVMRSWGAIAWRFLAKHDQGERGEAYYLAGQRLGCLVGSLEHRVLFL